MSNSLECGICKLVLPASNFTKRQQKIILGGEKGICHECLDNEFRDCQYRLINAKKREVETSKKKELEDLHLFDQWTKMDSTELASHKKEIDDRYQEQLGTLQKHQDNLHKKNAPI
jgi:hypothetical protein